MRVFVSKNGLNRQEGMATAAQRPVRMALILSFSTLGVAVAYFGALYLIAH
jgi:hypothetical protein